MKLASPAYPADFAPAQPKRKKLTPMTTEQIKRINSYIDTAAAIATKHCCEILNVRETYVLNSKSGNVGDLWNRKYVELMDAHRDSVLGR